MMKIIAAAALGRQKQTNLSVVTLIFDPSTQEAEASRCLSLKTVWSTVNSRPVELYSEILSQNTKSSNNMGWKCSWCLLGIHEALSSILAPHKPGMEAYTCNPIIGNLVTGGSVQSRTWLPNQFKASLRYTGLFQKQKGEWSNVSVVMITCFYSGPRLRFQHPCSGLQPPIIIPLPGAPTPSSGLARHTYTYMWATT